MNPYETKIQDIMDENIIKTVTTEDQEEVVELFNKYDLICLPGGRPRGSSGRNCYG